MKVVHVADRQLYLNLYFMHCKEGMPKVVNPILIHQASTLMDMPRGKLGNEMACSIAFSNVRFC